jgi:pyruvate dehydrogenase E2 component (dihydrolipoamide acetyltransferase)
MPRQGNTVESCIITDWKVNEGDTVTAETTVCEVETDKASFEVPAGATGTILKLLYNAGDDVPVLEPIAVIGETGEDWHSALLNNLATASVKTMPKDEPQSVQSSGDPRNKENTSIDSHIPVSKYDSDPKKVSPRAQHLAEKEALSLEMVPGTGPDGRIIERDVLAALQTRAPLTAAAKTEKTNTILPAGSGIGGRITLKDITDIKTEDQTSLNIDSPFTETPIKGIRKIIADRMRKSLAESAQFTLNISVPAVKLQEVRSRTKTEKDFAVKLGLSKVTITDLVIFAVSRTLPKFPYMNAHKTGTTIKTFERVHLGIAVDTPKGLMVPVIQNADQLSLAQISAEVKRLAAACQNGTVKPDELSGSTFTISNLGNLGITSFTPVLNTPEVAILGICSIELKPAALPVNTTNKCGCMSISFEPFIGFSLTINHEVVDGAPAARFLQSLNETLAQIDLLLN